MAALPTHAGAAIDFATAAIVAAHPDDEILWFSSVVAKVRRVVICYGPVLHIPERAAQRRAVAAALPLADVDFLDLPEPGPCSAEDEALQLETLSRRLAATLDSMSTVFTHNPWGEYGHADHRRANAAVNELSREMHFAVYISSYVARHRLREMDEFLSGGTADITSYSVDQTAIDPIFALYKAHGCWTWAPNWQWPESEHFLRIGSQQYPTAVPLSLFDVEAVRGLPRTTTG